MNSIEIQRKISYHLKDKTDAFKVFLARVANHLYLGLMSLSTLGNEFQ
jgi:hypothetical protein